MSAVTRGFVAREIMPERCAYCGAALPVNIEGIEAWSIGNRFVCNEFCADGVPEEPTRAARLPASPPAIALGKSPGPAGK